MIPASVPPFDFRAGALLLVDKPKGWTSFDVVNKLRYAIRRLYGQKKFKVGHAGTLDPMATGLLVICTGKWTKRLEELQGLPKSYTGTIKLGATTPSYDAETDEEAQSPTGHLKKEDLQRTVAELTGEIKQVPPVFSAIKVDGQPLYKKARRGEKVRVKARTVTIHQFELTRIELPEVDFSIGCSKGTYIRSIAHDFGQILKCGGYLTGLRRTSIGD
ncbi:MAG: tRNA pseudouridine(55) synthase TruB, partial [Bacteroidota bacterium]